MRQRTLLYLQIPLAVFLSIIIHGCSFTHTLKISEVPSLQINSPLRELPSKTFVINEFTDKRVNTVIFSDTGHSFVSDPNLLRIMRKVLIDELSRQGQTCVNQVSKDIPDYIIEGVVYKYSFGIGGAKFTRGRATAEVGLRLTVSPNNGSERFTKDYEGSFFVKGGFGGPTAIEMLNQAMLNAIRDFLLDKEFIEFLRKS